MYPQKKRKHKRVQIEQSFFPNATSRDIKPLFSNNNNINN